MRPKQILKMIIDILMTVVLLLLIGYSLVGEMIHEWLGIGMFALFILHHVLNSAWLRNVLKGKYTPFRILQTVLVALMFISIMGSVVSGVILSRHALSFLPITGGRSWARTVHILCAYWGFVFLSLHLGLHWNMIMGMAKRMWKKPSATRAWIVRMIGFMIAAYGIYAFHKREIGSYMFLRNQFVFYDFDEPFILFLLDCIAIMGLFVLIGHYLGRLCSRKKEKTMSRSD